MNLIKKVRERFLNLRGIKGPTLLMSEEIKILNAVIALLGEYHLEHITLGLCELCQAYSKHLKISKKYCQVSADDRQHALEQSRLYASLIRQKICGGMFALSSKGCNEVSFDPCKNEFVILL